MKHTSLALAFLFSSQALAISYTGFVTPTSLTYNFSSANLQTVDGSYVSLITDAFSVTFNRSDADFAGLTLKDVTLPFGRYAAISLCQTSSVSAKLDGVTFDGPSGAALTYGGTVYTVKTDNSTGTIATSVGSGAVTTTFSNSAGCNSTYFPQPLCVTDDTQTECVEGDIVYTSAGEVANDKGGTTPDTGKVTLQLFLMVDLYDALAVDSDTGQIAGAPNVLAVVGKPGAAIHLNKSTSSGTTNVSMLFSSATNLLTVTVGQYPGGTTGYTPEICTGQSNTAITGAPSGAPISSGIVFFNIYDRTANSNKGKSQSPTVGSCMDESSCNSVGVNVFENFLQSVGNNATGLCIADSAATPPYLGYTYTGGSGSGLSTPATIEIKRIVDPSNLFGICTSGYVSGRTGTCSTVNTGTDGYN